MVHMKNSIISVIRHVTRHSELVNKFLKKRKKKKIYINLSFVLFYFFF